MTYYGKFEVYTPENAISRTLYLQNEEGKDWYVLAREICQWDDSGNLLSTATGETFIAVQDDGKIAMLNADLSALVPDNLSVYGVDPDEVPENWSELVWLDEEFSPAPYVAVVPESITMRQAKLMLLRSGMLSLANDIIAAIPGDEGEEARIEWNFSAILERDHPLVLALGAELGLPPAQVDDLFIWASAL